MGKPRRCFERLVQDRDFVVRFEHGCETSDHPHRFFLAWLLNLNHLKPPGQRRIFFDVLLVFAPCRRSDRSQRSTRQRRLEQIRGVALTSRPTRADKGVRFVNKQNDRLGRCLYLVNDLLQPVFELSLVARASL